MNKSRAELDPGVVMQRLEAGVSRTRAYQGLGGPRLFEIYCEENPDWAKRAQALIDRNREAARFRKGANWRRPDPTRCRRGHDLTIPENVRRARLPRKAERNHFPYRAKSSGNGADYRLSLF